MTKLEGKLKNGENKISIEILESGIYNFWIKEKNGNLIAKRFIVLN